MLNEDDVYEFYEQKWLTGQTTSTYAEFVESELPYLMREFKRWVKKLRHSA